MDKALLKDKPDFEITSEDQARNWVLTLVEGVEAARSDCNVEVPGDKRATINFQRKAYSTWMVRHGSALGTLMALYRCRKISDIAYDDLRGRIRATVAPTIMGVAG